jgi:hypothetical protein
MSFEILPFAVVRIVCHILQCDMSVKWGKLWTVVRGISVLGYEGGMGKKG